MDIKIIAADLDDTLLDGALEITPRCREAVARASRLGVGVVLASGRMARSIAPYWGMLGLRTPVVACNGATVYSGPGGGLLYHRPVGAEAAREACAFAESNGWYVQAYVGDGYIFERECAYSELYRRISGVAGSAAGAPLSVALSGPPHKLLVIDEPGRVPAILEALRARYGGSLEAATSKPNYIEITHPEANKGAALRAALGHLGAAPENVMAIGDSLNDIPMFKVAGLAVAMGNAHAEAKRAAHYVTLSNDEDGAAAAIERFVL